MDALERALAVELGGPLVRGVGEGGGGNAAVFPLDQVTGAAFAYSTKRLASTYSGYCLRVVRPTDSATLDVGFAGQNVDASAIAVFLGTQVGQIDIWYDQSGNANHATQTTAASRPKVTSFTIGGAAVLCFDSGFMSIPTTVSLSRQAADVYCVAESHTSMLDTALFQLGSGANQVTLFRSQYTTSGIDAFFVSAGSAQQVATFQPQARVCIHSLSCTASAYTMQQDAESKVGGALTAATMLGGYIGNTTLAAGYEGKAHYAAVIGYASNLSAGNASALRGALRQSFQTIEAPTNRVIFEGDSITAAGGAGVFNVLWYGYAREAARQLAKPCAIYNTAISGEQLQNQLATFSVQAGRVLGQYSDNRIVFLAMGTNDLTNGARTAAQIYADIQTYAGSVRAAGGKVIVSTLLPNNAWNGTQQTTRTDLNTLIRTNWASFADGLADFGADATMGPQAAAADTTLYGDGLHPTRLGHSKLAPIAAAAINALL